MSTDVAEIQAKIRSLTLEDKTERICALIAELDGSADPTLSVPGWKKRNDAIGRLSKGKCSRFLASAFLRI